MKLSVMAESTVLDPYQHDKHIIDQLPSPHAIAVRKFRGSLASKKSSIYDELEAEDNAKLADMIKRKEESRS